MYQKSPTIEKGIKKATSHIKLAALKTCQKYLTNSRKRKNMAVYFEPMSMPSTKPRMKKYLIVLWTFSSKISARQKKTTTQMSALTALNHLTITFNVQKVKAKSKA